MSKLTAEWESRGGAHGLALYQSGTPGVYHFSSRGYSGSFPAASDAEAIAYMEQELYADGTRRVDLAQPDANTTPMRRVQP